MKRLYLLNILLALLTPSSFAQDKQKEIMDVRANWNIGDTRTYKIDYDMGMNKGNSYEEPYYISETVKFTVVDTLEQGYKIKMNLLSFHSSGEANSRSFIISTMEKAKMGIDIFLNINDKGVDKIYNNDEYRKKITQDLESTYKKYTDENTFRQKFPDLIYFYHDYKNYKNSFNHIIPLFEFLNMKVITGENNFWQDKIHYFSKAKVNKDGNIEMKVVGNLSAINLDDSNVYFITIDKLGWPKDVSCNINLTNGKMNIKIKQI